MRVNKRVCECIVRLTGKAGGHLRVESVQFNHTVTNELVSISCLSVKVLHITSEDTDQ